MSTPYVALSGRIRQSLVDLNRLVQRAGELWQKAEATGDDGYLDGVALNLHGFYAGIERIFEDIARTVDGAAPTGSDWHRDLLLQMSSPIDAVRPAVIRSETRYCLDEYLGFRHVVRNVYTFNLRPARIQELAASLPDCYQAVVRDLHDFALFLQDLTAPGEDR